MSSGLNANSSWGRAIEFQLFFSLIFYSSVDLWGGFSLVPIWCCKPLHSPKVDNLSPFDTKIACLSQSNKISNKRVNRQSQVRKPTGCDVKWAECSLIMGTGYRVSTFFSLIFYSSVDLWGGFSLVPIWCCKPLHSPEVDNLSPFDTKIACLSQSNKISNKRVNRQSQVWKPTVSKVKWAECSLITGTGNRVQVF